MDKEDLKLKFKMARHEISKKFMKKPKLDIYDFNMLIVLPLMHVMLIPQLFVEGWKDSKTTITEEAQEAFQTKLLSSITSSENPKAMAHQAIEQILQEENMSEKQAYDLLNIITDNVGNVNELAGYEIGNIGDLRECRVDNTKPSEIAACTVEQQKDDIIVKDIDITLTFLAMLLLMGKGTTTLMRRNSTIERWSNEKPRHRKFRH